MYTLLLYCIYTIVYIMYIYYHMYILYVYIIIIIIYIYLYINRQKQLFEHFFNCTHIPKIYYCTLRYREKKENQSKQSYFLSGVN